jgi:ribosome-binding ATPase YchF (GTP1/OBG family)
LANLVGVVGKPNVGKSTFFSAATMVSVPIANYPFTTIKPNRGIGYVRTPCVCTEFNVKDEPVNSVCINGVRLVPVEIVDCAGLVPDAWKGRGLGNQFLDEIRRADALIHVVDAAGATDGEGRQCAPGTNDPLDDVKFLERELDMWLFQIIKKDWDKISRRIEGTKEDLSTVLEDRLSGLSVARSHISSALEEADLDEESPTKWKDQDLVLLARGIRMKSKPMLIAANKIDLPHAEENVERLRDSGHHVIPCCAEAELALRRASEKGITDYKPGDSNFKILKPSELRPEQSSALETIREKILLKWGSTGVQESINFAFFKLLGMITVYPVEDAEKLTDHKGRVLPDAYLTRYGTTARQFAYMIHTELGEGFIFGVEARSKMRIGEDYVLKDRDVISIASARKRG